MSLPSPRALDRAIAEATSHAGAEDTRDLPPPPKWRRIVVGVDGEPGSEAALAWAGRLAGPQGQVRAVCAALPPERHLPKGSGARDVLDVLGGRVEDAAAILDEAQAYLAAQGVRCKAVQVEASPGSAILRQAIDWGADLVALGSHRHSALERLQLGSVSDTVKHATPCSVLVARSQPPPRTVLAAVDGSVPSRLAARAALQVAQQMDCAFVLHHAAGRRGSQPDGGVRVVTTTGPPAKGIVRAAKAERADLVVVGSRGLGGIASLALGSVSDRVTRKAPASILVVKGG
ncbi:MAG TPA: universal stress protein [Candidatus Thermoplasmatota archaeon]|nr:universal stress protein [Candidatus Thermoplasmatota archaeon]